MRAAKKITVDRKLLQELVPLNALSSERFREVSEKIVVEKVLAGDYLFRKGDRDNQSIYLLEGKVNLIDGFRKVTSEVEAGTDISRYPIANLQPRSLSARAVKKVLIAKVDTGMLDVFLTWDQSAAAEVAEFGADTNKDWMTRILQSEAFIKMPPSMIQSLLIKMEALPVKAGDIVIRQGDSGDYFYTIHEGRCTVTRKTTGDGEEQLLAEMGEGDFFGEDALVSDAMSNATVSMLTDGLLMRLAKKDFLELQKNQLVRRVNYEQAVAMVDDGAVWVDVRTPDEYENCAFEDSVNIPLSCLRDELSELVFNSKYVICCDTGRRSESAGFLLSRKGFDVYVLEGGIPGTCSNAVEPVVQEDSVDSDDALAEVIEFDGNLRGAARQPDANGIDTMAVDLESETADIERQSQPAEAAAKSEVRQAAALQHQQESDVQIRTLKEALNRQQDQLPEAMNEQAATTDSLQALEEDLQRQQQEWETERTVLKQGLESEHQTVAALREQLSLAELQSSEDRSAPEAELKALLDSANQKIEGLEIRQAELQQERSSQDDELQAVMSERTRLQQQLAEFEERNRHLESEIESAREEAESRIRDWDEQQNQLQAQLDEARARTGDIEKSNEDKDAQINSLQEELAQRMEEFEASRLEYERLQQQMDNLHSNIQQQEERARALEEEHLEAARKAHEDITRKNDNEKELQGQIDRLRKKLEQQTTDQQKARDEALEDLEQLREQLHAERQARAEERAEMAARQRELKDQLAVIATEHEARLTNQSGAIEQARDAARQEEQEHLRELLAIHVETEDQVARLQHELKKAHEEIAEIARHEKDRRRVDIDLMEEQNQQALATISQLESQLKQFTEERDAALEEQQTLRYKMNALRGEVEVARGLMSGGEQVEDHAQLRKELNESKKNIEIAVRLRAEAEAIRDRALQERDTLQQQLNSGELPVEPLHVPSLDDTAAGMESSGSAQKIQQVNLPVIPPQREQDEYPYALVDGKLDARERRWLGTAIGLGVVTVCALAGWLFIGTGLPVSGIKELQQMLVTAAQDTGRSLADSTDLPVVEVPPDVSGVQDEGVTEPAALAVSQPDTETVMEKVPEPVETITLPAPEEVAPVTQSTSVVAGRAYRDSLQGGGQGPVMVELPAGSYEMGSIGNSLNFDESPRHPVTVPALSVSKFEVTHAEYGRFARATGRRLPNDESWGRGDRPVINVSWGDANAYTRWLSQQSGKTYRLPSEAEWEYATRAGISTNYWWTDDSNNPYANCFNCGSEWDGARTSPVGSFDANNFGLHDVAGNVQEWTADCYHGSYQGAPDDGSAWLSPECTMRVVRGGAYTSPLNSLRSAKRSQYDQDTRLDNLGFRVVREN